MYFCLIAIVVSTLEMGDDMQRRGGVKGSNERRACNNDEERWQWQQIREWEGPTQHGEERSESLFY